MGVTGAVRSIFFRNKSFGAHDYRNGRSNLGEKKRWSSVRSYLCGDEFNSLLAVDDSAGSSLLTMSQQLTSDLVTPCDSVLAIQDSDSVKHFDESVSEATVTQPLQEQKSKLDNQSQTTISLVEDAAAVIIQSAFRNYLAIRLSKQVEETEEGFSPGKLSMGTSPQVQTGNSVKAPFYRIKRASTKHENKIQLLRLKQDWDGSTLSSTISRLRIQSRIEAMTKRERALAYAFSQQLRICSKKKQTDRSSEDESNIGWSWLERWMATRVPDSISIKPRTNIQIKNRPFSITSELESCASNDLPLQFESISDTVVEEEETEDFQRQKSSVRTGISKTLTRHDRIQATKSDLTKKAKKAKTTPSSSRKLR